MKKFILMGLCLLSCSLRAAPAATVLFTKNDVKGASGKALTRGSSLQVGDSIMTGKESLIKIKYTNGTFVTLGEKSTYKILAYSPKQGDVEIKAELSSGIIDQKTTHKTKEELKTPTIALAISGTHFGTVLSNCHSTGSSNSKCTATVIVTEGVVEERNANGTLTPIINGKTTTFNSKGEVVVTPANAEKQLINIKTVADELPTTATKEKGKANAVMEPKAELRAKEVGEKRDRDSSQSEAVAIASTEATSEAAAPQVASTAETATIIPDETTATPPVAASLQTTIGTTALIQNTAQIATVEVSAAIATATQIATITACIGLT